MRHLRDLGIEVLYVLHFDETLSKVPARGFIDEVLGAAWRCATSWSATISCSATSARGSTAMLQAEARAGRFGITVVPPVLDAEGRVCSSTNIRRDLAEGKPEAAARLLGRCWEVEGRVVEGDKRGRTIGFPTANIGLADYVHPNYGVYAVWAGVDRGGTTTWHPGVANVGKRPTFKGEGANVETYIFDIAADLYGDLLRVAFVRFLRPGAEILRHRGDPHPDRARLPRRARRVRGDREATRCSVRPTSRRARRGCRPLTRTGSVPDPRMNAGSRRARSGELSARPIGRAGASFVARFRRRRGSLRLMSIAEGRWMCSSVFRHRRRRLRVMSVSDSSTAHDYGCFRAYPLADAADGVAVDDA